MKVLRDLFKRSQPQISPELTQRVTLWQQLPEMGADYCAFTQRCVVLDLETSGLDMHNDVILSIGAVAVEAGRIDLGQVFYRVVRQDKVCRRDNILIHGITPTDIDQGAPFADTLVEVLEFIGKAPLIAFHARFDQTMLSRAVLRTLGLRMRNQWLDLAWLLPALYPQAKLRRVALDRCADYFGLSCSDRHRADSDALLTAELWLLALSRARQKGGDATRFQKLLELAKYDEHVAQQTGISGV